MTGRVDSQLRALLRLPLAASRDGPRHDVEAWVDTAFNGGLQSLVTTLQKRSLRSDSDPMSHDRGGKRAADRARARSASRSRLRGSAAVTSDEISVRAASVTS
jgi:hypothetical protein